MAGDAAGMEPAAVVERTEGSGAWVVLCDHADNRLPSRFGTLGLAPADLTAHFAWDPGALPVARALSAALDAPLVRSTVSRLVIDCNREPSAPDSIVEVGEATPIPGNRELTPAERARRVAEAYAPYHAAVEETIAARLAGGVEPALVAIHTFTPAMHGRPRPWHVGVIFDDRDATLARAVAARLAADPDLHVGLNEPYSPADRVYHTLERHGLRRGLPTVMIELRNDLVGDEAAARAWGDRLAGVLREAALAPIIRGA
ncbi:N-formylglutamate amidohydrolase [Prosthecomicrobium sp. N25]|uniref:N-formylglutamate amidohydrolase n=1 Tax=Prosthecomicrobium sp. N25 TaxID=3129254 RepID=UPI0030773FA9